MIFVNVEACTAPCWLNSGSREEFGLLAATGLGPSMVQASRTSRARMLAGLPGLGSL